MYGDDIKLEDIQKDPTKYGAPTFEEFCKNPDKFSPTISVDEALAAIDNGGQNTRRILKERTYHVGTQIFKSLEKAVDFCRDHNIKVDDWKVVIDKIPGHWGHEKVIFMEPEEWTKRQNW